LRTILTPEQSEKWKSYKKVAKAERKVNKTPEAKADQAILKMDEVVGGLDNEQKAKLKPILIKKIVDVKAIRKNDSLSEDERKAKIKPIRQSSRKQINSILTSEQKKKWKAYKKSNKDKVDQLED
jgi:Spy/CpxP family protein refolding chaperone